MGFPVGSDSKESTCNAGNLGSISGLKRSPGGGNSNPHQYPCLEVPHGQWRLACYSPWGPKEWDTINQLSRRQQGHEYLDPPLKWHSASLKNIRSHKTYCFLSLQKKIFTWININFTEIFSVN